MRTYREEKQIAIDTFERKWLVDLATSCSCNLSRMARVGGIDRSTLYRIMYRHDLTRDKLIFMLRP